MLECPLSHAIMALRPWFGMILRPSLRLFGMQEWSIRDLGPCWNSLKAFLEVLLHARMTLEPFYHGTIDALGQGRMALELV